jgi:3',5'-cyclic AMP phosphodiesterase CpdA
MDAQMNWLRADLAASPARCTLAVWHHPLYSSGDAGSYAVMQQAWELLYQAGAELVLSGHDHDYERFGPQDALGNRDDNRGMRQFVGGPAAVARAGSGPVVCRTRNFATAAGMA